MTGRQRRLTEVVRSGDESDPRTRELVEEVRTVIAACDTAARAMTLGYSTCEVEDRALRARVPNPPLDPVLTMAAASSNSRPYGYRLLAERAVADIGRERRRRYERRGRGRRCLG